MTPILRLLLLLSLICLTACGGKSRSGNNLKNVYPYSAVGSQGIHLKNCATATTTDRSCSLNRLPTLAMEVGTPTVDDVMSRVLVSHHWMGQRFEQALEGMPEDMLYLLGSVTAVVIDANIRPAYYWSLTGAIYLDPDYLWVTEAERATISSAPDYRHEYIARMAYRPAARYTQGLPRNNQRTLESMTRDLAQLLFHELAHASDLLPRHIYDNLNPSQTIVSNIQNAWNEWPSSQLLYLWPLESDRMFELADILYRGATPSATDRLFSAAQVGEHFAPDRASDDYAYSSQFEDVAMLFEEVMMKLHFGLDRDVAFLTAPASPASCNDYKIGWGERGRIGLPRVRERAQWVTQQLLPHQDYSDFFAELEAPTPLPTGAGWCESETQLQPMLQKFYAPYGIAAPEPIDPRHLKSAHPSPLAH